MLNLHQALTLLSRVRVYVHLTANRMVAGPVPPPSDGEWTQPRGVARFAMAGAPAWAAPWDQESYSRIFKGP